MPDDAVPETPSRASRNASPRGSRSGLGAPGAQLAAWGLLALVNAAVIAITLPVTVQNGATVRIAHHLYDAGHLVALGVVSHAVAGAWARWGPRRVAWVFPALALLAFLVALLAMQDDLAGFVERRAATGGKHLWYALCCAAAGLGIAVVAFAGWVVDRPYWRWLAVAVALAAAVANHLVLRFNYPGVHLFAAWASAVLLGASLTSARPALPAIASRRPVRWTVHGVAVVAATTSLVLTPTSTVWRELFRTPGTVVAPFLARFQPQHQDGTRPLLIQGSPWFRDRSRLPDVPPTGPSPVADDTLVLFITIDALRPDVLTHPAHAKQLPTLEAIRQESVEFTLARAPSPSTVTTLISVFTGKYYSQLYWSEVKDGRYKAAIMPHEDDSPRLAGLLSAAGVPTVQVIALHGLTAELGVGTGFDEEILTKKSFGRAGELMGLAIRRLKKHRKGPLFMAMHFVDSHGPYNLAGTHGTQHERYVRELELVDRELRRLREFLEQSGLAERTVLIVSADHGEAFGEHNTRFHAVTVYEELVRIPLFIRVPGVPHRVVDEPVTLMDVAPTVLDLYGAPTPGSFLAQSLVPFLRGESPKLERPIAVDAGRRMQALYCDNGHKAIADLKRRTVEVYDLAADPKELRNLVDADPDASRLSLRLMAAFFEAHRLKRPGYEPPWRRF